MADNKPTITLRIPGTKDLSATKKETKFIKTTSSRTYRISAVRAAAAPPTVHPSELDEVVEIEFEDGTHLWTSSERLCRELIPSRERKRSTDGAFELPVGLAREDAERGTVGRILFKTLSFFGVDVAGKTAKLIAQEWEKYTLGEKDEGRGPGLYRCATDGDFKLTRWDKAGERLAADRPVLLFLHGTASTTRGSFGELWGPDKIDLRKKLFAPYGKNVLALEHGTLSASPVQNAIDLVGSLDDELPPEARLHLLSHSRGGLVGELLCRSMVKGEREPFTADELETFRKKDPEGARGDLAKLNGLLKERRFQVERFVRVACPTWGTTLASNRLDLHLSILFNLLSKIPFLSAVPGAGIALDIFTELIMLVAKERSKPAVLPGIEAMIPGTPLVQLLNRPDCTVGGELRVIAGDIEGDTILSALGTVATDPLFRRDNDLVVETDAMFGGANRTGGAASSFHQGPHVSHFRYFKNNESAERILKTLTRAAQEPDGFEPFEVGQSDDDHPPYKRDVAAGPRPVVFLLPGIMGSHLAVGTDRIWLDPAAIAFGKFDALRIDAVGVKPEEPVWMVYGDLVRHLSGTHEVVPFAYDWRASLKKEAARLAGELDKAILRAHKAEQPVSIIAHSTGGLLARTVIATQRATWDRLCAHSEARLIMLGTPNGGSYCISRVLTGRESLVKKLALLDMQHDPEELLGIFSAYPGVLELLPEELLNPAAWEKFSKADSQRDDWHIPSTAALDEARKVRDAIAKSPLDPARVFYVAGHAPATPSGMTVGKDDDGSDCLVFQATSEGDGWVPWQSGIPAGVKTWYLPAVHGDLANHEESFGAIVELLRKGNTDRLETSPPVSRGVTAEFVQPEEKAPLYTGFRDLARTALGGSHRPKRRKKLHRVPISVVHGNLGFTHKPIMVGHYQGDTIVSAEAYLDRVMDGRLRARHALGLYPGAEVTAEVFLNPKRQPGGAIIIGLGEVGKLSPGKLTRAVSRGVRSYVITLAESGTGDPATVPHTVGIATLLVGTNAGGVALEESVTAILQGVANALERLHEQHLDDRVVIDELEFIELFEDRAIHAIHALDRARSDPEIARSFLIDPTLRVKSCPGGLRRAFYTEDDPWWQRLEITENRAGRLTFNILTDRARAEVHIQQSQRSLAEQFINEIIASTDATSDEVAVTLFEMLVPNEIKEYAPDRRDMVLVLNEEAARYPWEMMREHTRKDLDVKKTKPLSVQAGMIRQLQVELFRDRVVMARGQAALVVGNPPTEFVNLPGAEAEAQKVHKLLREGGYESVGRIGAEASGGAILKELYARDYRIVHLAGHGVYEHKEELNVPCDCCGAEKVVSNINGMVIGKGQFLTPAQLHQMRAVPELVFVNCCHLGKIEKVNDKLPANHPPKLAANIATELIRMGVKAVVAAGWEVNDKAAQQFAATFYQEMLAGVLFGEAVLKARLAVFDAYPKINTWGAYQCYGDPAFRLTQTVAAGRATRREPRFTAPAEVITRLDNLTQEAKTADDDRIATLKEDVAAIDERIPTEWLGLGEIFAAMGRAHGELEEFEKAVDAYRKALADEKASCPVKALEQLWNLQARWAVEVSKTGLDQDLKKAHDLIDESGWQLKALIAATGETTERLSLLGSAAKRKAVVATDLAGKKAAIEKMAGHYKAAYEHSKKSDSYPQLNCLAATVLLSVIDPAVKMPEDIQPLIRKEREAADERQQRDPVFWNAVTIPDCLLLEHLATGDLAAHTEEIISGYLDAKRCVGSPREFRSVLEHLDFLANIIAVAPDEETKNGIGMALATIREELGKEIRTEPHSKQSYRTRASDTERSPGAPAAPSRSEEPPTSEAEPPPSTRAEPAIALVPKMSDTLPEAGQEPQPVQLGASAPRQVKPGAEFTARFVAYEQALEQEVRDLLKKLAPSAETVLGIQECRWKRDTQVTVTLSGRGLTVDPPEQTFTWQGGRSLLAFDVTVPDDAEEETIPLKFDVVIAGIIVARLPLELEITARSRKKGMATATGEPARTAFASYSSKDRLRVLDRVDAIQISAGIDVFQDCLDLNPGEEWKPRLDSEIRQRDLFLLFWSNAARKSQWVGWELDTALKEKGEGALQVHPLDPEVKPPPGLEKLNIGSVAMWVRKGVEASQRST